jgi:hypothetical protein
VWSTIDSLCITVGDGLHREPSYLVWLVLGLSISYTNYSDRRLKCTLLLILESG